MRESSLPEARLRGEVARSTGQLRMFADVLEEGSLLEVIIDTADAQAKPVPRPDLRRVLVPLGPVLVFAASNFPFAFSVCGGDTASALAAGCPVIVKAHPGHPELSRADGRGDDRGPAGGRRAGRLARPDPGLRRRRHRAEGPADHRGRVHRLGRRRARRCTRSPSPGREPIPFYGELGSLNPVFVTQAAVDARGNDIATGYVGSFTLGVGQFCTKPGLLFLPAGHGSGAADRGDRWRRRGADAERPDRTTASAPGSTGCRRSTASGCWAIGWCDSAADHGRASCWRGGRDPEECFGPVSIVVEYDGVGGAEGGVEAFEGNLTATLTLRTRTPSWRGELLPLLTARAGRVLWNGWPTGVAVSWAQHHGGPFPSTVGSIHTSVGVTAARRFQRPVAYQDAPDAVLPAVLKDSNPAGISRRVNGTVTTGEVLDERSSPDQ